MPAFGLAFIVSFYQKKGNIDKKIHFFFVVKTNNCIFAT
jgi:hypothetical protein